MSIDPFTGLPLTEIITGTTNPLGTTATAEEEKVFSFSDLCPLESFKLESSDGSSRGKRKIKYVNVRPKRSYTSSDTCYSSDIPASDTVSVHSTHDDTDSTCGSSIPESAITVGRHQLYKEAIKDQSIQLRKLADSVLKTQKYLNIVKDIAVTQIVDSKEIYERRIRDMTNILKQQQIAMNEKLKIHLFQLVELVAL